jgi:cytochrome c-type biogenesis protein CcmH/NrfG
MSTARTAHPATTKEASWTSTQAYGLAVFCLLLGVTLGYLFRGTAPVEETTTAAAIANTGRPQGMGGQAQQLSAAQQKQMIERAVAPLLQTLKTNPEDFEALAKVGNIYYDAQQFPEAIQYYDRALQIKPENSDVRTDLGTALWYTGDADRAIAEFQKALKYRPGHPETLFNLGVVRWQGKTDPKGAVEAWEELLKQNPNYPQKQQVLEFIEKAKQHAAKG